MNCFDSLVSKILQGGTFVWTIWFIILIFCIIAQHVNPENHFLSSVVAGAITGIFETLLMFPIENLKTQQQLTSKLLCTTSAGSSSSTQSNSMSFYEVFKRTVRLQGIAGLYAGMGPVLFCAVPNQALRWTAFDTICQFTGCDMESNHHALISVAIAGIGSGMVVSLVTGVPVETAKTLAIHQGVVQQQHKLLSSHNVNNELSSSGSISHHLAVHNTDKDVAKQSDTEDEDQGSGALDIVGETRRKKNNNMSSKHHQEKGAFSSLFSQQKVAAAGDIGEDSDIDVLEGATIQPLLMTVTPASQSTTPTLVGKSTAATTTYKTQDGIVITVINNNTNKNVRDDDENGKNINDQNENQKSWEEELEEASSEKCKQNPPGLLGWILSLLNNNNNHSHAKKTINPSLLRGWLPTVLKKVCNQGVRFPVHKAALDFLCFQGGKMICSSSGHAATPYHAFLGFLAGAISGIVSIFITQPIDVVKTRMQGLQADRYGHSWSCALQLLREEGAQVFFHGMGARALRSGLGAGFAFTFFPIVKAMLMADAEHQSGGIHH